jgi:hypothetical protein
MKDQPAGKPENKYDGPFPSTAFPKESFPRSAFPWMGDDDEDENNEKEIPESNRT